MPSSCRPGGSSPSPPPPESFLLPAMFWVPNNCLIFLGLSFLSSETKIIYIYIYNLKGTTQ